MSLPIIYHLTHRRVPRLHSLGLLRTFFTSSSTRSGLAPSFSSSKNIKKMVTKLGVNRVSSIIFTGKPNTQLPSEFGIKDDQFIPGAISAVGVVTNLMASGDWDQLEGLVDRNCISNLQASMVKFNSVQQELVVLNPDDVFLSFISNPTDCDSGKNLHLVTFSQPKLGLVKSIILENKGLSEKGFFELLKENKNTMRDIKEKTAALNTKQDLRNLLNHRILVERLKKGNKVKEHEEELQKHKVMAKVYNSKVQRVKEHMDNISANKPLSLLATNEIVVGNYRLQRDSHDSPWTITELAQINSQQAWAPIFRARWKARLTVNTVISIMYGYNYNFYTILRADYVSLYFAFLLTIALLFV